MTVEFSLLYVMQFTGAYPVTLVVGHEEVAFEVKAKTVRGTQSGCPRIQSTVRGDLENPTSIGYACVHALKIAAFVENTSLFMANVGSAGSRAERYVEIASFVPYGPEVKFVLVPGYAEVIAESLVFVCFSVFVKISKKGKFGALGDHDFSVVQSHDSQWRV
jgi:hypothetical protein